MEAVLQLPMPMAKRQLLLVRTAATIQKG